MLFVGTEIQLLDGKGLIKKECLQSTLKVTIVSQSRILTGTKFHMVAAECLKARDATFVASSTNYHQY